MSIPLLTITSLLAARSQRIEHLHVRQLPRRLTFKWLPS
jgi:hypothetical protein